LWFCCASFLFATGQQQLPTKFNAVGSFYGSSILLIDGEPSGIILKQAEPMEILGNYFTMAWLKNNQLKKVNFLFAKRTFRNNISDQTGGFDNFNDNYFLAAEFFYGVNLIGVFNIGVLGGTAFKFYNEVTPKKGNGYKYEIVTALKKSFSKAELFTGMQLSLEYKVLNIVATITKNVSNIYGKGTLNGQKFSIASKPYFYTVGVGYKF
jgi:hypothetical protein